MLPELKLVSEKVGLIMNLPMNQKKDKFGKVNKLSKASRIMFTYEIKLKLGLENQQTEV